MTTAAAALAAVLLAATPLRAAAHGGEAGHTWSDDGSVGGIKGHCLTDQDQVIQWATPDGHTQRVVAPYCTKEYAVDCDNGTPKQYMRHAVAAGEPADDSPWCTVRTAPCPANFPADADGRCVVAEALGVPATCTSGAGLVSLERFADELCEGESINMVFDNNVCMEAATGHGDEPFNKGNWSNKLVCFGAGAGTVFRWYEYENKHCDPGESSAQQSIAYTFPGRRHDGCVNSAHVPWPCDHPFSPIVPGGGVAVNYPCPTLTVVVSPNATKPRVPDVVTLFDVGAAANPAYQADGCFSADGKVKGAVRDGVGQCQASVAGEHAGIAKKYEEALDAAVARSIGRGQLRCAPTAECLARNGNSFGDPDICPDECVPDVSASDIQKQLGEEDLPALCAYLQAQWDCLGQPGCCQYVTRNPDTFLQDQFSGMTVICADLSCHNGFSRASFVGMLVGATVGPAVVCLAVCWVWAFCDAERKKKRRKKHGHEHDDAKAGGGKNSRKVVDVQRQKSLAVIQSNIDKQAGAKKKMTKKKNKKKKKNKSDGKEEAVRSPTVLDSDANSEGDIEMAPMNSAE